MFRIRADSGWLRGRPTTANMLVSLSSHIGSMKSRYVA